jgi:hypothetical protein
MQVTCLLAPTNLKEPLKLPIGHLNMAGQPDRQQQGVQDLESRTTHAGKVNTGALAAVRTSPTWEGEATPPRCLRLHIAGA